MDSQGEEVSPLLEFRLDFLWRLTLPDDRSDLCSDWAEDPDGFLAESKVINPRFFATPSDENGFHEFYSNTCRLWSERLPLTDNEHCFEAVSTTLHFAVLRYGETGEWSEIPSDGPGLTPVEREIFQQVSLEVLSRYEDARAGAAAEASPTVEKLCSQHFEAADKDMSRESSSSVASSEAVPMPSQLPPNVDSCRDIALYFWPYLAATQDHTDVMREHFSGSAYGMLEPALREIAAGAAAPGVDPIGLIDQACSEYDQGWRPPTDVRSDLQPVVPHEGPDWPTKLPENVVSCQDVVVFFSKHMQVADYEMVQRIVDQYFPEDNGSLWGSLRSANGDPGLATEPAVVAERVCTTGPSDGAPPG